MSNFTSSAAKLARSRLNLLRSAAHEGRWDSSESLHEFLLEEYLPLLEGSKAIIQSAYVQSLKSLNGHELASRHHVRIIISRENPISLSIKSSIDSPIVYVEIGYQYAFLLDISCSISVAYFGFMGVECHDVPHAPDGIKDFIIKNADRNGLKALNCFYRVIFSNSVLVDAQWSTTNANSLFWAISHEIGHYACGHVGYAKHRSQIKSDAPVAQDFSPEYATNEHVRNVALNDQIIRWCAEFMADAYATLQMMQELTTNQFSPELLKAMPDHVRAQQIEQTVSATLQAAFAATLLIHEEDFFATEKGFDSYYPSHRARLFGIGATAQFFIRPLPNASNDLRDNPAREYSLFASDLAESPSRATPCYLKAYGAHLDWHIWAGALEKGSDPNSIHGDPAPHEPTDPNVEAVTWLTNVLCAASGITSIPIPGLDISSSDASGAQNWGRCIRLLARNANLRFSRHLPRKWVSPAGQLEGALMHPEFKKQQGESDPKDLMESQNLLGGFVSDPTYKILDDWLSRVYAESSAAAALEQVQYCIDQFEVASAISEHHFQNSHSISIDVDGIPFWI